MKTDDQGTIRADPSPRSTRYPGLDLWRGVACLAVVLYHAGERGYPWLLRSGGLGQSGRAALRASLWGWAGVPLFFVISGYCIAASADSARRRPGGLRSYAIGRLRRVFPAYWAALGIASVALLGLGSGRFYVGNWGPIPSPAALTAAQWAGNVSLTESWAHPLVPGSGEPLLLLGPSWTLCYEVQFYAVVGLILAIAPRRLFAGAIAVSILSLACSPLRKTPLWPILDGTFLDGRWLVFAIGMLVYHHINIQPRRAAPWLLALSASAIVASGLTRYHLALEMAIALGFGAALCAGHRFDPAVVRSAIARPFLVCGSMCYSLYLVHWPVVRLVSRLFAERFGEDDPASLFASMAAGAAASLVAGWLFHRGIERRFLNPRGAVPALATPRSGRPAIPRFNPRGAGRPEPKIESYS